jgi:hypothetical protein
MSAARAEYEAKIREINKPVGQKPEAPAAEASATDGLSNLMGQQGTQTMQAGMAQGNGMSTAGGGLMAVGAATANPYLMAGGAGLSLLGAAEQNKRNQEEAQRVAYNDRIMQRQKMMQLMAQQGIQ